MTICYVLCAFMKDIWRYLLIFDINVELSDLWEYQPIDVYFNLYVKDRVIPYFVTGITGICRDQSFWRCYEQKDKRKVSPYRLKEWKDSNWVAMEDFILNSLFFLLSLQSSLLWIKRNTTRDRKDIFVPHFLTQIHLLCFSFIVHINKEAF